METSRSVEIRVGIFVTVATALTLAFVIALGGDKGFFKSSYHLKMVTEETSGLANGSVVQVSGIQCGNIVAIDFEPGSNNVVVTLKIDKRYQDRITKGSLAGIHTQGALGDKYIMIKPGPAGEPIPNDGVIEVEPATDILSTLGKSGNRVERVFEIMDEAQKLLKGLNDRGLSQNLAETAKNLKSATGSFDEVMASIKGPDPKNNKIKKSLDHLNSVMEKIDDGQGTLGGLINDPTVHEDLKTILGGAKRSKLLHFLIKQATKGGEDAEKEEKETPKK